MKFSRLFGSCSKERLAAIGFVVILLGLHCHAEQFVDIKAEINCDGWDWLIFSDEKNVRPGLDRTPSIFYTNELFHCVIGTNTWFIEREGLKYKRHYWFTGTNIIDQTVTSNLAPFTTVSASADGNPDQTVRVADRMTFDTVGRICWLALASGPTLKHDGRHIFPPSDEWKESQLGFSKWFADKTTVFDDALGLPKTITLLSTNNQPVLEYCVHLTTNAFGWNFPLELYLIQYQPSVSNGWRVYLTAKGRIISIGPGTKPEFPKEVAKPDYIEK